MTLLQPILRPCGPARRALAACILSIALSSCQDREGALRERIAGDYVREERGDGWHVRQVLTLRRDGSWLRTGRVEANTGPNTFAPDSGTYRILGVTLNLRSLAYGGVPIRYTMLGDTLFGANAAQLQAQTGHDMGEERFVRAR